ncbi:MAG: NACHT domain-containing protein [Candidatus Bathyarchaeia archaeon]
MKEIIAIHIYKPAIEDEKMSRKKSVNGDKLTKGRLFENKVASLYELLGFTVQQNISICNKKVDILATYQLPGTNSKHRIIVECKNEEKPKDQNKRVFEFTGLLSLARKSNIADSAEIITSKPWSDFAKGAAQDAGISLLTFKEKLDKLMKVSEYIDRVIYDFEHFNEYVAVDGSPIKTPIIESMNLNDLYHTFVPLNCRFIDSKNKVHIKPIEDYIEKWLADPYHNHLSILGDFGTGKSSFCLYLTYKLAKYYKEDNINSRIPLFIPLRGYSRVDNLQKLIKDLLETKYHIVIDKYAVFQRFLENGNLILIFDGFDEMSRVDKMQIIDNFEELAGVVVSGSKTILTCRTHYFTDQHQVNDILRHGKENGLLQCVGRKPNFQIIELKEFSDEQIKRLLMLHNPKKWEKDWLAIHRNLYDLARRPLLLDMIIETLPVLLSMKKTVNAVHLYHEFTELWIKREQWLAQIPIEEKRKFMLELAMKMWNTGSISIPYTDLKEILKEKSLDPYDNEVRTRSFLNRDSFGNYQFIHKSFMEFFVAKIFFEQLKASRIEPSLREKEIIPEISSFTAQFVSEDLKALENLCQFAFDETHLTSWNAISILSYLKYFNPEKVVPQLVKLCQESQLKSGVTWLFGELGINSEEVKKMLNTALTYPNNPRIWWEAAFALHKLEPSCDPIKKLIKNLPTEWSYAMAIASLEASFQSEDETKAWIDQRAIVAIVKEHRQAKGEEKIKIEEEVNAIFCKQNLPVDTKGRRPYYAVWLIGELKIFPALPNLLSMSEHPQAAVRNILAEALGKIGSEAQTKNACTLGKDELKVLKELLLDPYFRTRIHAAEAIRKANAITLLDAVKDAYEKEPLLDVQREQYKTIRLLNRNFKSININKKKCAI